MSSSILNILEHLANTPSRKNKESILKNIPSLDEELFIKVVKYALDPQYDYYIKEFDMPESYDDLLSLEDSFTLLEQLNNREVTGDAARTRLDAVLTTMSASDAEVLRRIIKRDLRCGVSAKTVNKIWPDLIYDHPYMRASSFNQKNLTNLQYPCISQTKMDGLYCDIIIRDNDVVYMTRNGSKLPLSQWDSELTSLFSDTVLQGELLARNEDGAIMERSLSNGYINSDNIDETRLAFYCWDVIALSDFEKKKSTIPYAERFEMVEEVYNTLGDWFQKVDSVVCEDADDVLDHFKKNRAAGEEGTIVKNMDMIWKNGTSKDQVKVKVQFSADFRIVGWKEGKGKFAGMVGSIECESSDGLVNFSVSGFSDAMRKQLTQDIDKHIENGTIIEVKSNDVINNTLKPDRYALFLPRFVEIRVDKDEADSYDRVVEQLEAYTDMLKL